MTFTVCTLGIAVSMSIASEMSMHGFLVKIRYLSYLCIVIYDM